MLIKSDLRPNPYPENFKKVQQWVKMNRANQFMLQSTCKKKIGNPSENDLQKVPVHKRNMKEISSEKFKKKSNDKIPRTVNLQHIS